jgi:hypothetical protein
MKEEEIIEQFELFLNESGNWINFKSWIEDHGYTMSDFKMKDE